jgi:hypothetical protein
VYHFHFSFETTHPWGLEKACGRHYIFKMIKLVAQVKLPGIEKKPRLLWGISIIAAMNS